VALRVIEERATLADSMAADAGATGRLKSASLFEARSKEMRGYAEIVRKAILA
jgi:hypothetical protein